MVCVAQLGRCSLVAARVGRHQLPKVATVPLADSNPRKRQDGLYRVTTNYLCAGFVIEDGKVTRCAPILRRKLAYWMTVAERIT